MLMSGWIIFALVARLFMAMQRTIEHHIDTHYGNRRIISAIVLQNITAGVSLALIACFHGIPSGIDSDTLLWVNIGVISYMCAYYPYLKALQRDNIRNVAPLFEMTPVILTLLAFLTMGETMDFVQMLLAVPLVGFGFAVMWDWKNGKMNLPSFGLMLVSAILMALYFLSMRIASHTYHPLDILWMIDSGFFMAGLVMLIIYPRSIGNIKMATTQVRGKIILWELLNGLIFRLVSVFMILALYLAPNTGVVAAFSGTQPLFVMAFAILLWPINGLKFDWKDQQTRLKAIFIAAIILLATALYLTQ